jgi:hypothetical protein
MAATAAEHLGLTPRFAPLDRTSFHVDGRYNRDEEPAAQVVPITRGDSRAHRPDLNQVRLELMVEQQVGILILMKPRSGNSSDAHDCGAVVCTQVNQLQTTSGTTSLVADSALYSAANLQKLAPTRMRWMTRVPATLSEAQAALAQVTPPPWHRAQTAIAITSCCRPTVGLRNAGSSSIPRLARLKHSPPSPSSGASRVTKTLRPFRNDVGLPVHAKPMHGRHFRSSSRT